MDVVELDAGDAEQLHALFAEYGWWDDRTVEGVARALEHTPLALGVREEGELLAAVRVLTDFVYYARVYDVVVAEDRRGDGVGTQLLEAVVDHPDLSEVKPVLLCRAGLVSFYESVGFEPYPEEVAHPDGEAEPLRQLYYPREG